MIVAQAGRPGAVTIATNMAGRGTDIVLGGNLHAELGELEALAAEYRRDLRDIDRQLGPANDAEKAAKDAIAATLPWAPSGSGARAPYYGTLTELAARYGGLREKRRRVWSALRGVERQLQNWRDQDARVLRRTGHASGHRGS